MEKIKEQLDYEEFMVQFEDFMINDEYFESFYAYGPLSNSYWTAKTRILVCNLEPYDEREGVTIVDIDLFKEWMDVNTGVYTARFIAGLISKLNSEGNYDDINFKSYNRQELLFFMKEISYMNFRISSGKVVKAEKKRILVEVQAYKGYLVGLINTLSPEIIIIGGVDGCKAYNILHDGNIKFNTTSIQNGKVICSMNHFSRANYKEYSKKVNEIVACYQIMRMNKEAN